MSSLIWIDEPAELRAGMRRLLGESPEAGHAVVNAGHFLLEPLWCGWGEQLLVRGGSRRHLIQVLRGYSNELRYWILGERTWDHCLSGLTGRVERRLSAAALGTALGDTKRYSDGEWDERELLAG